MQMWFNSLIEVTLSEGEKKVLVIIFLVFLLFLLFVGLLTNLYNFIMKKVGTRIDKEISGYYKYGFVQNEKEYKAVAKKKNQLLLLKQLTIPLILIGVSFLVIGIYCRVTNQDMSFIWSIYYDMLIKFDVTWTNVIGIPVWEGFPTINENSFIFHGTADGIFAYIFFIIFLTGAIWYICSTLAYMAREKRIKLKAKSIFSVKLDDPNELPPTVGD